MTETLRVARTASVQVLALVFGSVRAIAWWQRWAGSICAFVVAV
jgi:hypothetical protein